MKANSLRSNALVAAMLLLAGSTYATDYIKLTKNTSGNLTCYTDGSCWDDNGLPPSSDKDYMVGGWMGLYACDGTADGGSKTSAANPLVFPGNSLTLGEARNASRTGSFSCYFTGTSYYKFERDGLVVNSGSIKLYNTYQYPHMLGKITVVGDKSHCVLDMGNKYYSKWYFEGDMHAAEGAGFSITGTRLPLDLYFNGDMSDYAGELEQTYSGLTTHIGFSTMPGTFTFDAGSVVALDSETQISTIGTLAFAGDTTVTVKSSASNGTNAQLVVTTALTVADGVKVHVQASDYFLRNNVNGNYWQTSGEPWKSPFITAPKGQLDVTDFVFDGFTGQTGSKEGEIFYRGPYAAHFEIVPNADGLTETMFLVQDPMAIILGEDPKKGGRDDYSYVSSLTNAERWSDLALPHVGVDYILNYQTAAHSKSGSSYTGLLQLPQNVDDYVFPGQSLTVCGFVYMGSKKSATFDDLRLIDGGRLVFERRDFDFYGNIRTVGTKTHYLYCTEDVHANIHADISGEGEIYLAGNANYGTFYIGGECEFLGDNSGFAGTWLITVDPRSGYPVTNERVFLNSANDFGAPPAEFVYNSVTLTNKSSVTARKTLALAGTTRGILIAGEAEMGAPDGVTFTVNAPITFAGTLTKSGAGVLALGAKPRFTDGGVATAPTADQNVLLVKEGYVRADVPQALDNLAITVSDGAGLAFSAKPTGDVATTGLELANVSIAAEGKVAVALDPTTFDESEVTVPLFTGTRAQVNAMLAKCRFVRPAKGWGSELVFSGTDDRLTASAKYHPVGLAIILR